MSNMIHQIWISEDGSIPENVLKDIETFKTLNPDKEHKLWTNEDIGEFGFEYISGIPEAYQTDVIRLHILKKYGGWYIDADMVCKKPLTELEEHISLDKDKLTVMLSSPIGLLSNGMFYSPIGFNFDAVLEPYKLDTTMIQDWDKWIKSIVKDYDIIPFDLVGYDGKYIKDLRTSSWRK